MRSSNGWGSITVPGGRLELQRHADLLHRRVPAAGRSASCRRSTPSTSRRASRSTTPSAGTTGRSTPASLASNDTLLRPGPAARIRRSRCPAYVAAPGVQVRDVRHPVQQDDPAAARRDLGLQRHATRSTRATPRYNPAASSLPRAASWDRNLATTINAHFDANGVLFGIDARGVVVGQAVRRGPDAAHASTKCMVGTARQFGNRWSARALRPLPRGQPLLGRHEQQRAHRVQLRSTPASIPRELYIPDLTQRLAADRQRLDATSSPSSTAPTRSTTRRRSSPSGATTRRSSAARTPGATTTATSTRTTRRRPTTPTSSSARRSSATAPAVSCGTSGRRPARRPPAHAQALRLLRADVERDGRRLRRSRSRGSRGRRGATSRTSR